MPAVVPVPPAVPPAVVPAVPPAVVPAVPPAVVPAVPPAVVPAVPPAVVPAVPLYRQQCHLYPNQMNSVQTRAVPDIDMVFLGLHQ